MGFVFQVTQEDIVAVLRAEPVERVILQSGEAVEDAAWRMFDVMTEEACEAVNKVAMSCEDFEKGNAAAFERLREVLVDQGVLRRDQVVIHDRGMGFVAAYRLTELARVTGYATPMEFTLACRKKPALLSKATAHAEELERREIASFHGVPIVYAELRQAVKARGCEEVNPLAATLYWEKPKQASKGMRP